MTEKSMIALSGLIATVKGRSTAPKVSMLTPGMAPNSIPPIRPRKKIITEVPLPKSVSVP
ncbi:hypothetical protein [Roseovarius sp.]